jgi:hypothetical protein
MGETPTLNDSLPPKHRQFSLEDVEDHYLEWLEKWIAEIESGPPDICRGRYRSMRGSPVLKTGSGGSRSWVRIPPPPPTSHCEPMRRAFRCKARAGVAGRPRP